LEGMIRIRRLNASDVDAVLAIQAASPEAAAWNRQAYEGILADAGPGRCLVAVVENTTAAFATFRVVEHEAELLNLAVLPAFRRRGVASGLLEFVLQAVTGSGAADIFLEVRDSNLAALELYKHFGFEITSRRPAYY